MKPSRAFRDWALFGISIGLAYIFSWTTKDLLWSFWLGSFFLGSLAAALHAMRKCIIDPDLRILRAVVMGLVGLIAFSFHSVFFGLFYGVFAGMMDLSAPLMAHPGRIYVGKLTWKGGGDFSFWETLKLAVWNYWPWLIIMAVNNERGLKSDDYYKLEMYWDLLRMFFLMFVMMVLEAWQIESFFAVVVILFYFFIFRSKADQGLPLKA